jgi:hypothetical protein
MFIIRNMKLGLISLLLPGASVLAHVSQSEHETSKPQKWDGFRRRTQASLLPIKTNHSTIDWKQDDQPFRLGNHQFASMKDFKDKRARCGTSELPESARITSQEQVEEYLKAHQYVTVNSTHRLLPIEVPVYFHCIKSGTSGACSSSVINQQIAVLNAAYAPTFSFNLVSSRSYNRPEYYTCSIFDIAQERRMKEELHLGSMNALNVYSCNSVDGILGWSTFPDGSFEGGSDDV